MSGSDAGGVVGMEGVLGVAVWPPVRGVLKGRIRYQRRNDCYRSGAGGKAALHSLVHLMWR